MFARIHTLETTEDQYERGFRIVSEKLLPWARESSGFRGVIGLFDRTQGKTLVVTLWADKEALDASAAAGDRLSDLAAAASGATRRSLEDFEVTVFDVLR